MQSYQDWCIEAINVILGMKYLDEGQYGYKMIVKDLIRHYPEVFMVDGQQEHFWTKAVSQGGVDCFRRSYVESFIMTAEAYEIVVKGSVDEIRSSLYQEHITPVQYIFDKLKVLRDCGGINSESIRTCMVQNKLVLLHDDEKGRLDRERFTADDFKRLQKAISNVPTKFIDANLELAEAEKLVGRSSKCKGSGLFRLCKLLASDIRFCDVNGKTCSDECLIRCLVRDFKEYTTS